MFFFQVSALILVFSICKGQEYDFGAEISRQCLVPDPVGLLDCVENKVTLPYLTSWVDCTNSLGENVRTSADIINYRCKSVWEGKGVIPEVFYIKDCVIEKTGLPAKNVSAEVLGAYKECESSPKPQVQQPVLFQSGVKTAPIQQQQIDISGNRKTSQPILTAPRPITQTIPASRPVAQSAPAPRPITQAMPALQPVTQSVMPSPQLAPQTINAPRPLLQQQPFSQQYFVLYPRAPLAVQKQVPITVNQQQQIPASSYVPQIQQISQQLTVPITNQQRLPASSYVPQTQQISQQQFGPVSGLNQQQLPMYSYIPQAQQFNQYPLPSSPAQVQFQVPQTSGSMPNNRYYYGFQIQHPQSNSIKM